MHWLRDKYDFFETTVRRVNWDGGNITFEMEDVYDKNGNCDIIKDHILLDRLTLTFGQAVVEDGAKLICIGNSILPQSTELDFSDKGGFNSFFESITPIYIRDFRAEKEDTAAFFARFSDKKRLKFELSCDEISNTDGRK